MRVTHDDGVELTFDNIVNDSSLYAFHLGILNRNFFSESECSSSCTMPYLVGTEVNGCLLAGKPSRYVTQLNSAFCPL